MVFIWNILLRLCKIFSIPKSYLRYRLSLKVQMCISIWSIAPSCLSHLFFVWWCVKRGWHQQQSTHRCVFTRFCLVWTIFLVHLKSTKSLDLDLNLEFSKWQLIHSKRQLLFNQNKWNVIFCHEIRLHNFHGHYFDKM
jgi:hypothetical protein